MKKIVFFLILIFFISCSSKSSKVDDDNAQISDDSSIVTDTDSVENVDETTEPDENVKNDESPDIDDAPDQIPDNNDDDVTEIPDEDNLSSCTDPITSPTELLTPQPGELFYMQMGLAGISMGESAMIVGPDGTITLVDAGNDSHDKDITKLINNVISQMNSNGFPARSQNEIDNVIITHLHADHSDGLQDLMENVSVKNKVIHRGFFDITDATDAKTVTQLCDTLEDNPGKEVALCEGPARNGCNNWASTLPSTGCSALGTDVAKIKMGEQSLINIFAVNGHISNSFYGTDVAPFLTEDSNGENARSVTAILSNGNFRLLFAGDITGGGSDTDAVEGFYALKLGEVTDIDDLGVDIIHAGHHGRNTSNSPEWVNRLLPNDGKSRNMIMGISTAHINSPHQETLDTLFSGDRLKNGNAWATTVATGGANHADLINAFGGNILILTEHNGKIYHVQAVDTDGKILFTKSFYSVKGCK